ncbi:glycosyltransferase [Roseovarius salinarum]|uniref:glycosyltransferase n=1 Tax=Roseovarius salinarum TaxID=1981892 RepID=UPI001E3A7B67|nr:glycosyltransferase [Roseovarius salinarum]
MGISELRQVDGAGAATPAGRDTLGADLVQSGIISRADESLARLVQRHCDAPLARVLEAENLLREADVLAVQARRHETQVLDAEQLGAAEQRRTRADPRLLIKHGVLPVRDDTGAPFVITPDPDALDALPADLEPAVRDAQVAVATRHEVQQAAAAGNRAVLTDAAQRRVPATESCRTWGFAPRRRLMITLGLLAALAAITVAFPLAVLTVLVVWAAVTLLVSAGLKTAAFVARVTAGGDGAAQDIAPEVSQGPLPRVSILVPLYRETEIAHALIARLTRLTYPKCLLDVILVLEEDDATTLETLAGIDLPPWIRPVVVPEGQPRTKPRAMNYALDFCEGEIIGILDAEDAPEPDQITRIARRFQSAPEDVVCLQGVLDYYNARQNWLARCFTIEYATWFRSILPGMRRLGLAIPLGGTTLYFRRAALEELGGWDAHNVTEDADLGFRLARHGYRTEMVDTVTGEEANCRLWPWIKQRSRWLKGYMATYLVHMRRPALLRRQLGRRQFWGFQAHFVSAVSQVLLAPFLWLFWLLMLGKPDLLQTIMAPPVLITLVSLFLMVEAINICIHLASVSGREHGHLMKWTPTMHFYGPLGAIAAYKALYELVFAPYFWDKTAHGHSLSLPGRRGGPQTVEPTSPESSFSRVTNAFEM